MQPAARHPPRANKSAATKMTAKMASPRCRIAGRRARPERPACRRHPRRQCAEASATSGREQHSAASLSTKSCHHAILHAEKDDERQSVAPGRRLSATVPENVGGMPLRKRKAQPAKKPRKQQRRHRPAGTATQGTGGPTSSSHPPWRACYCSETRLASIPEGAVPEPAP